MSDDDKKEFDDGKPDPNKILRQVEGMMSAFMPKPITFVIARNSLCAHFEERASHYMAEVGILADRPIEDFTPEWVDSFRDGPTLTPSTSKELQSQREQQKKMMIESARARALRFAFMADHLALQDTFTIDLDTAMRIELIPHEGLQGVYLPR